MSLNDFFPDRLASYLRARLPDADGPPRIEPIGGGQSNPTYWLRFDRGTFVLRKQPPGKLLPSAHAIDREYRVLTALAETGVPVPRTFFYSDDLSFVGTPFYVMEALEGRVFSDSALPGFSPPERAAIYGAMNETLARLHKVDWRAVGLGDFGKPGGYYGRQIARWTRQWESSKMRDIPEIDRLIEWLPRNIPEDDETTVVHGDYRLGNLIFHPTEPRVIGLVDWELSTLGHPLADLAYNCIPYHAAPEEYGGLRGLDREALGIPGENEYVARYCASLGRADGITAFHLAFALFRFAVILEGVAARAVQGNAAAENARQVGQLSVNFGRRGWAIARG